MIRIYLSILILSFLPISLCAYELEVDRDSVNEISHFYQQNFELLQKIKDTAYHGIEIIVADENETQAASRFGHAAVRFVGSGDSGLEDYVVSLEMFITNADNMNWNAIFGGYEVFPRVYTLIGYINKYQVKEGRGLDRIVLPSNKRKIDDLLGLIEKMMTVPDLLGDYNFLRNNCMTALLKLLSASGVVNISYFENFIDIPSQLRGQMARRLLSPFPSFKLHSATSILTTYAESFYKDNYNGRRLHLPFGEREFVNTLVDDNFWVELDEKITEGERGILDFFWPQTYLLNLLNERIPDRSLEVYIGITQRKKVLNRESFLSNGLRSVSRDLYSLCTLDDEGCRQKRIDSIKEMGILDSVIHITREWYRWRDLGETYQVPVLHMEDQGEFIDWYEFSLTQDMLLLSEEIRL